MATAGFALIMYRGVSDPTQGFAVNVYPTGWYTLLAGHLFWIRDYLGHPDVRMLDGGWEVWLAAGGRVVSKPSPDANLRSHVTADGPSSHRLLGSRNAYTTLD